MYRLAVGSVVRVIVSHTLDRTAAFEVNRRFRGVPVDVVDYAAEVPFPSGLVQQQAVGIRAAGQKRSTG